ncbi:MAG: MutS-related protein [Acidimicrobiales bacterium]|jgi:hypothetical protein
MVERMPSIFDDHTARTFEREPDVATTQAGKRNGGVEHQGDQFAPYEDPTGGSLFPGERRPRIGLLFDDGPVALEDLDRVGDCSFAVDLNLDQIVASIVRGFDDQELLSALYYQSLHEIDAIHYRQEVFKDLEDGPLFDQIKRFSGLMRQVRARLAQLEKIDCRYQREGSFLSAVAVYCEAVLALVSDLRGSRVNSRALHAFKGFLEAYVASDYFCSLDSDTRECKEGLARIRYCVRIRGGRVDVSRYVGENDYSTEVLEAFSRFAQGAAKDYLVEYRGDPPANHVSVQILEFVARLFAEEFTALNDYSDKHAHFFDETVECFERETQFYLAYLDYIRPLRSAGLQFCYPQITKESKEVFATRTFDLALAKELLSRNVPVVPNGFHLEDPERIFVVSGPNQGGKTTFARTFGQLHHFASLGCPVPGRDARLFLFDQLFTHFEREEDLVRMRGKLEDDLVRVAKVLQSATTDSIVILNEIFSSTTLDDARFLGKKVLEKVAELDLLCVYVTFVDELASFGDSVVSMVSSVDPDDPTERTYEVVRAPADGLAYALAIAGKYGLTYDRLRERLSS